MTDPTRLLDRLVRAERSGMKLGLNRFRRVLADLDHPERRLRTVLVAGTNGKGSVATILARLLQVSGYRTGLFTSPHLLGYRERVRVDGRAISRREIGACMRLLGPALERRGGSFFEAMTGLGILHFQRQAVDIAVFEVGLGGRLDATNVGTPVAGVVVGIGLDHTHILGHTVAAIAREKAAIARRGRPLVIGAGGRARAVLVAECARVGAPTAILGRHARYRTLALGPESSRFRYRGLRNHLQNAEISLAGRHQVRNAAVALLAAETLGTAGYHLRNVDEGLRSIRWPGRLETMPGAPPVLLDGAHNPDGARSLARFLGDVHEGRRLTMVVGMLQRKDVGAFLKPLRPFVDRWVITRPSGERGMDPGELAAALDEPVDVETRPAAAVARARRLAGRRGLVCVCGSLRLVGEVMRSCGRRRLDVL